jgi:hypothetical protein
MYSYVVHFLYFYSGWIMHGLIKVLLLATKNICNHPKMEHKTDCISPGKSHPSGRQQCRVFGLKNPFKYQRKSKTSKTLLFGDRINVFFTWLKSC